MDTSSDLRSDTRPAESPGGPNGFFCGPGTELFQDQYCSAHVRYRVNGHFETHPLRSQQVRRAVTRWYFGQGQRVGRRAVRDDLELADAFAETQRTLANRSAWDAAGTGIWIDLANLGWEAVHVTADGWRVVADPPPLFRRFKHQSPLPTPDPSGDVSELRDLLPQLREPGDWLLTRTWLVTAAVPMPHPILVLVGTQGAAKSTASALLRRLLDPSRVELLGKDARADLPLTFHNHAVPVFDNVDRLSPAEADLICQVVTGRGIARRQLYSNNDEFILSVRRPIILNGLHLPTHRADFLDRCLPVYLDRIPAAQRIPLQRLEDAFRDAYPRLFGGLLNLISLSLRELAHAPEDGLGRMADFHRWGRAVSVAAGESPDRFDEAYKAAEQRQKRGVAANTYLQTVLLFARAVRHWKGTPHELFKRLHDVAREHQVRPAGESWPDSPASQGRMLPQVAESLAGHGVTVTQKRGQQRIVEIRYDADADFLGNSD